MFSRVLCEMCHKKVAEKGEESSGSDDGTTMRWVIYNFVNILFVKNKINYSFIFEITIHFTLRCIIYDTYKIFRILILFRNIKYGIFDINYKKIFIFNNFIENTSITVQDLQKNSLNYLYKN